MDQPRRLYTFRYVNYRVSQKSVYVFYIASHFTIKKVTALKLCMGEEAVKS